MPRPRAYRMTPCTGNLKFGEMEFGEMKRNASNWSNFCMLPRNISTPEKHFFKRCWTVRDWYRIESVVF